MSDEFKDVSTVPTLTLEPFQPEAEKQAVVKTEEPPMDETILTEEERKMVDEFAKQIDLTNSGLVLIWSWYAEEDGRFLRVSTGKCKIKRSR